MCEKDRPFPPIILLESQRGYIEGGTLTWLTTSIKEGEKGGVPSSVADGRHTRDRGCPSYFIFPIFFSSSYFFSCSSSSTCVLLLLQAMFSITVNTGRANNSVRAFRLEKDILFHSYMPNIRALSWPLKCYLTGRFDGARRGLERNLWTSESMGRKNKTRRRRRGTRGKK